ncbi:MAG: hypothetical protein KKB70_08325 [Proteobacteria bacterium]|nr:hypothetical protein [Pseudomonadota bacterium]
MTSSNIHDTNEILGRPYVQQLLIKLFVGVAIIYLVGLVAYVNDNWFASFLIYGVDAFLGVVLAIVLVFALFQLLKSGEQARIRAKIKDGSLNPTFFIPANDVEFSFFLIDQDADLIIHGNKEFQLSALKQIEHGRVGNSGSLTLIFKTGEPPLRVVRLKRDTLAKLHYNRLLNFLKWE